MTRKLSTNRLIAPNLPLARLAHPILGCVRLNRMLPGNLRIEAVLVDALNPRLTLRPLAVMVSNVPIYLFLGPWHTGVVTEQLKPVVIPDASS